MWKFEDVKKALFHSFLQIPASAVNCGDMIFHVIPTVLCLKVSMEQCAVSQIINKLEFMYGSLLYNGYRVFPGYKERPGRDANPSLPF